MAQKPLAEILSYTIHVATKLLGFLEKVFCQKESPQGEHILRKYFFDVDNKGYALDFGCGERGHIPELAQNHVHVVGLDLCMDFPAKYSLRKAKEVVDRNKLINVDLINADCHKPPFKSNCFDIIIANHVLEHLMEPGDVLKEVKRILKPNGQVFIAVPSLSEICSSSFNPNPIIQWGKILLTRALDDIRSHKPSFLKLLFFRPEGKRLKLRRFIPHYYYARLWYRRNIDIEEYVNEFLSGKLQDPHHKHWFTRKEWVKLVKNNGLKVSYYKGLFTVYILASKCVEHVK